MTRVAPAGPLHGRLRPPPDKSISHRAAIVAAMGESVTPLHGYLEAADTHSTLTAIRALGAHVEATRGPAAASAGLSLSIEGIGLRGPGHRAPKLAIDVGNAGTLLRLLPGWLAGQGVGAWTLDGDESIRRRPVDRVAEPLRRMGAAIECRQGRLPPLRVEGAKLRGITYELPVPSAQVKSCVLLAALLAEGASEVVEPAPTRDHSERMLAAAGASIRASDGRIRIEPVERLEPERIEIPGDFSSAAFALVAALLVPGSEIRIEGVGLNPTRIALVSIAERMGGRIEVVAGEPAGPEPRGEILVRSSELQATEVEPDEVAVAIDELPLVALLACFADGESVVRGAGELRHKESDRLAAIVDGLRRLGAQIEPLSDGFAIRGAGGLRGGTLDARGDHRLAMLGAVAGLASRDGVEVAELDVAGISYPGFERDLRSLLG
jgi:3-phosphoshikimate 1-carboxyvinyltransferase